MSHTSIELTNVGSVTSHTHPGGSSRVPSLLDSPGRTLNDESLNQIVIEPTISKWRVTVIICNVTAVELLSSALGGLFVVQLPTIASDVHLQRSLLFWPSSINALMCGCTLLILGSITDVIGSRPMYLLGIALQCLSTLATGLSTTGPQLLAFYAFEGLANSCCIPSSVSIFSEHLPSGKSKNIAFAIMGASMPIGFSLGLVFGGLFADTIGWRWGFYMTAISDAVLIPLAIYGLPKPRVKTPISWNRFISDIDWMGAIIASASLAMLSYVLASLTTSAAAIGQPANIALLVVGVALIPAFVLWVDRQERLGRPAIIPNSLWSNPAFTFICLSTFLAWGAFNAFQFGMTLFFQDVQLLSPLQTSIRFLPEPILSAAVNIVMGLLVHRIRGDWLIDGFVAVSAIPSLVMAIAHKDWIYWSAPFVAVTLCSVGVDTLYTISNLVITALFPAKRQGLAGGVFQTIAQFGRGVGFAAAGLVAQLVTERSSYQDKASPDALFLGYKALFWFCFAATLTALAISAGCLRSIGKVGLKRE